MKNYKLAALGGTFDRLHKGHRTLLTHACTVAQQVVVGITKDELVAHKPFSYCIESFDQRFENVGSYLQKNHPKTQYHLVSLDDIYGPTLTDQEIDCLVVSPLTEPGAKTINSARASGGLPILPIQVCKLERSGDGKHISSERIRSGLIDREGFFYQSLLYKDIEVNEHQKQILKKPLGEMVTGEALLKFGQKFKKSTDSQPLIHGAKLVTVGDRSSLFLHENHIPVDLFVFDNKVERKPVTDSIQSYLPVSNIIPCENPPGTISNQFTDKLLSTLSTGKHIKINGEEDLTLLPCILLLPLGSVIFYGQPGAGMVKVVVSEERKAWVRKLLESND